MPLYVVPNDLRDTIYAKVDAALEEAPEATPDREVFYDQLLSYFNQHGVVPDFTLVPREQNVIIDAIKDILHVEK